MKPKESDHTLTSAASNRALLVLAAMHVAGLLVIVVYQFGRDNGADMVSGTAAGLLLAAAGTVLGALVGFLFGIPRLMQGPSPAGVAGDATESNVPAVAYGANTNLEQISDWLTKILVGVGLTQLGEAPHKIGALAQVVGPSLGTGISAQVLAGGSIIYFCICGFIFSYLWTRLFLAAALQNADLWAFGRKLVEIENQSTHDAAALQLAAALLESTVAQEATSRERVEAAVTAASPAVRASLYLMARRQRTQSWQTDKLKMERTIPVFRALIRADQSNYENYAQLGYALKDKVKPDWQEALKMLSRAIELRGNAHKVGMEYHEFNRALCRIGLDSIAGAPTRGTDESRAAILRDLKTACAYGPLRDIVLADDTVKAWAKANDVDLAVL